MAAAHPRVAPLYAMAGLFDEILPARGARAPLALTSRLRRFSPERAVVFTRAPSGALLARLSGAQRRLGWRSVASGMLTDTVPAPRRDHPLWRQYAALAEAAGGTTPARADFRLDPGETARRRAEELLTPLGGARPVAVAPGAAYGAAKRWPLERFEELTRRLTAGGESVVVLGGRAERALGTRLAAAGAMDLTGKTSLVEAIAVLARARVLVTNDSGALHLARAAGTQVVALFGSSAPVWTGPEPGEGTAIHLGLDCSPCFRRSCPLTGPAHLACLTGIDVDRVLGEIAGVAEGVRP